jgi:hypothetical protein
LKFLKSDVISQFLKCREKFFRALEMPILQFSFELSEHPKITWTDIWRVGWMGSSENRQAPEFISKSMLIVSYRVVHAHRNFDLGFLA